MSELVWWNIKLFVASLSYATIMMFVVQCFAPDYGWDHLPWIVAGFVVGALIRRHRERPDTKAKPHDD